MNGEGKFPDHVVAEAFLQTLHRGDDFIARTVAARPQPQLTPSRPFEDRQLDPQLRDRRTRLPFLDP